MNGNSWRGQGGHDREGPPALEFPFIDHDQVDLQRFAISLRKFARFPVLMPRSRRAVRCCWFPRLVLEVAQEHGKGKSILAGNACSEAGNSSRLGRRVRAILILAALAASPSAVA